MVYMITHTIVPELLDVIREWVLRRQPPHAAELLQLIARRRRELEERN